MQSLCTTIANRQPVTDILSHFSDFSYVKVVEHGLFSSWPFTDGSYVSLPTVQKYFEQHVVLMGHEHMLFHETGFVVDTEACKACMQSSALFLWIECGTSFEDLLGWDKMFVPEPYRRHPSPLRVTLATLASKYSHPNPL
jgi:hypothetical protein